MLGALKNFLAHPLTRDLSIDDPRTTERRREIIRTNRFAWRIYDEWYRMVAARVPAGPGHVLELGSGAGFMAEYIPGVITSEVFSCPDIQVVADGCKLPFASGSLKAIAMVDVLHHIPDCHSFLREARRCLRAGGSIVMVEPWTSTWSRLIWGKLHHEPFVPDAADWSFPATGPLSGANGALPWILFVRDREKFTAQFPELKVKEILPFVPFRYLVSGGVSMRQLMPDTSYGLWNGIDSLFNRWPDHWAMFALIHLRKQG